MQTRKLGKHETAESIYQAYQAFIAEHHSHELELIAGGVVYPAGFWQQGTFEIFLPIYTGDYIDTVYAHTLCDISAKDNKRYVVEFWRDCEIQSIILSAETPVIFTPYSK